MSFFFLAKFGYFSTKKLRNFWNYFFLSANLINFFFFWAKFHQIFYVKKLKKRTLISMLLFWGREAYLYASMLGSVDCSRKIGDGPINVAPSKNKKKNLTSTVHPDFAICQVDISCSLVPAHTNPSNPATSNCIPLTRQF